MRTYLAKLLLPFAGLTVLTDEVTFAKTVTIAASNADQTAYFQTQVNSLADGDTLVIAPGNHYINAYIDIWFNYGSISGAGGAIVRKIFGTTSGLTLHGNHDNVDQTEIDGGGPGTHGPCMAVLNGTANVTTNSNSTTAATTQPDRTCALPLHRYKALAGGRGADMPSQRNVTISVPGLSFHSQ